VASSTHQTTYADKKGAENFFHNVDFKSIKDAEFYLDFKNMNLEKVIPKKHAILGLFCESPKSTCFFGNNFV
jgi:hypothetical protein